MRTPEEAFRELLAGKANVFLVGATASGGELLIGNRAAMAGLLSREAAANLAAWLIMVGNLQPAELGAVFAAVGFRWPPA